MDCGFRIKFITFGVNIKGSLQHPGPKRWMCVINWNTSSARGIKKFLRKIIWFGHVLHAYCHLEVAQEIDLVFRSPLIPCKLPFVIFWKPVCPCESEPIKVFPCLSLAK